MKKTVTIFIISFALALLNGYFFNYINDTYLHFNVNYYKHQNITKNELHFIAIFVAPFIETLVFQYFLYLVLTKWIGIKNKYFCIIIMSIIFASMHYYNWLYIVMTFFGGIILNNLYIYYNKHVHPYSFILTVLFHALFNLFGFLFIM
ncbi:CAAX protease self-immunity [Chryseobacterium rhizoplanae]|uniref:CAAX protease self-immunity n=1 Tax=Chryseobacterium rhizoplanae TaxID=1609531 RepID=A0A521CTX6_9FLAO|nr:CPBP family intramembrane glutamic endopeptidase [Chryseobacterium rhizoplanae]SMO62120.1 CAAX protease self-immunity [Chryseobacterium rhizoplanae]